MLCKTKYKINSYHLKGESTMLRYDSTNVNKTQKNILEEMLLMFFVFVLFFDKLIPNYIYVTSGILLIIYSLVSLLFNKRISLSYGVQWQLGFVFVTVLTLIPSMLYYGNLQYSHIYVALTSFFILTSIALIFDGKNQTKLKIEWFLKYFAICSIIFALYLLWTQRGHIGYGRLGSRNLSEYFGTATALSFYSITGSCVLIWLSLSKKKHKLLYMSGTLLVTFINFLTGGRKAVFLPILFFIIFGYFEKKDKFIQLIKWFFISLSVIFLVYIISTEVRVIYDVFGYRLEDTINELFSYNQIVSETSKSNYHRLQMIRVGLDGFIMSPLLGHGFGMFQQLMKDQGYAFIYAHNNYIDMLVSGGILLFLAYYWIHIKLLKTMISMRKKNNDSLLNFFIAMLIVILVSDFGTTSYHLIIWNIFIILASSYVYFRKRN